MSEPFDTVVVGAGIAGCMAARELATDCEVLVLDRSGVAGAATGRSAGLVAPTLFFGDLAAVARHANAFVREFDGTRGFEFTPRNRVDLVTRAECEAATETAERRAADGFPVSYLDAEAVRERYPDLTMEGFVGAVEYRDTGWVGPYSDATALAGDARARGAPSRPCDRHGSTRRGRGRRRDRDGRRGSSRRGGGRRRGVAHPGAPRRPRGPPDPPLPDPVRGSRTGGTTRWVVPARPRGERASLHAPRAQRRSAGRGWRRVDRRPGAREHGRGRVVQASLYGAAPGARPRVRARRSGERSGRRRRGDPRRATGDRRARGGSGGTHRRDGVQRPRRDALPGRRTRRPRTARRDPRRVPARAVLARPVRTGADRLRTPVDLGGPMRLPALVSTLYRFGRRGAPAGSVGGGGTPGRRPEPCVPVHRGVLAGTVSVI